MYSNKTNKNFKDYSENYVYKQDADIKNCNYVIFPLEVDTEYQTWETSPETLDTPLCENLTVQFRGVDMSQGVIFALPDNEKPRHKLVKHGFYGIDYLEHLGHVVKLEKRELANVVELPIFQFDLYAFFAVAELFRIFQGEYLEDIRQFVINPDNTGVKQQRRLTTYTRGGNKYFNWIEPENWLLTIDDRLFRVRINIYDTSAAHGKTNYQGFCTNSNVELKYKDNFTPDEKSRMKQMYHSSQDRYDPYALGDLYNYPALLGNMANFHLIYQTLKLTKYFTPPKMTIGATESRMVEAAIKNLFNVEPDNKVIISKYCKYATADWLKRKVTSTACLNAKVDGGRCRNNRPIDTVAYGVLADIDISGCYGEGLRAQIYPLGVPCLIDYPANSAKNKYLTLREFLARYRKELVPGLWQARVELREDYILEYKQDFLISWFPPKDISRMPTDTDIEETDQWWTVDNVGLTKIFTNEIINGVITHDFIQWLEHIAAPRQRKELLDNLLVKTAMYYPASERVESPSALEERTRLHKGMNTTEIKKVKGSSQKHSIERECHAWYGINLGELLIDKLLIERKKHPKKTPFNELYKLAINTIYGDMVSPFFKIGNVVVGNNITARARALAWYMEKGFHGWQSITDGCVFDLNRVLYARNDRKINGCMTVGLYADNVQRNHRLAPLLQDNNLSVTDNYIIGLVDCDGCPGLTASFKGKSLEHIHNNSNSLQWINERAMKHLQNTFPNVDVLHQPTKDVYGNPRIGQFAFETKGIYDTGIFHGSANYALGYNGEFKYAMRSYTKKSHRAVSDVDGKLVFEREHKPSECFLKSLIEPNKIQRSRVYIKDRILKCGDYKNNYKKWRNTQVYPGCTIEIAGILHEFSLSQFTFQTYAQYKSWLHEYENYLRKYGQSYEMFYLDDEGCLNYQNMVEDIDAAIRNGDVNYFNGDDKRAMNAYRRYSTHQESACLAKVKQMLEIRYGGYVSIESVFADDSPVVEDKE